MSSQTNAPAVEACHQCLLWLIPAIDKFPRLRRFTLGEKLETNMLDVLSLLTQAAYQRNKTNTLSIANQKMNIVVHLWRLSYELKVIDRRRYLFAAEHFTEISKQIGGWRKASIEK